jgi:hypothetical protein
MLRAHRNSFQWLPGLVLVHYATFAAGLWLPAEPLNFRLRSTRLAIYVYEIFLIAYVAIHLSMLWLTLMNLISDFPSILRMFVLTVTFAIDLFRSMFLIYNRQKIISVIRAAQNIIFKNTFHELQPRVLSRVSRMIFPIVLVPSVIFICFRVLFIVFLKHKENFIPVAYTHQLNWNIFIKWALSELGFLIDFCKITSSDALLLGLFYFISEELSILKLSLLNTVYARNKSFYFPAKLESWLQFQHSLSRYA